MPGRIDQHLKSLGITLPQPSTPAANYVPWVRSGSLVFVAGQLPIENGRVAQTGIVGQGVSVDEAYAAARLCAVNILAHLRNACDGDLDRVTRIVKVTGFIASAPGFSDHPQVLNGASDFFAKVFGEAGTHARVAVGASCLPRNGSVEVEAIVEIA
jgi:enamine deaminase RidA (YjgF/YER057c/UK114 family)